MTSRIEFVVRVPRGTPLEDGVFLTGDAEALGAWRPDAIPLRPHRDGTWRVPLTLPRGLRAHVLVTLGSWQWAEIDQDSIELAARPVFVFNSAIVELTVTDWGRVSVCHHPSIPSRHLPHARPVSVWLPPGYDHDRDRHYPVFYLHDGQNLFDPHTAFGGVPWRCDETAERMIREGLVRPVILVGVGNTPDRIKEYGPSRKRAGVADFAKNYGRFLVEELKPLIDGEYRTLPGPESTAVGGSSMGGLISLYLARWHPGVFGRCAALSPSLWYNREAFLRTAHARPAWLKSCRLWLDFGTREGPTAASQEAGLRRTRELAAAFRDAGLIDDRDFHYEEIDGGTHSEGAWAARFDRVLRFLFGTG